MEMGKEAEMRNKNLYTKVCPDCNKTFRTDKAEVVRCYNCEKKDKAAIAEPPPKKPKKQKKAAPTWGISLAEFCRALTQYNERHGACYTYGQATYLVDSGKISRREFLKH